MEFLTPQMKENILQLLAKEEFCYSFNDIRELCGVPKQARITDFLMTIPNIAIENGMVVPKQSELEKAQIDYYSKMPQIAQEGNNALDKGLSNISKSINNLYIPSPSLTGRWVWPLWWM